MGVDRQDHALAASALVEGLQADAPIGFAVHDEELRFELVSNSLAAINGRPASEHLGRRVTEILPPELASRVEALGGSLSMQAAPGAGTRAVAHIPPDSGAEAEQGQESPRLEDPLDGA